MVKKFKPHKFVIEHGTLTIGTMGMMGLAGRMPSSPTGNRIVSGMDTMKVIPTIHVVSGTFGALGNLERIVKKKRR